jgi:hypothetical protein
MKTSTNSSAPIRHTPHQNGRLPKILMGIVLIVATLAQVHSVSGALAFARPGFVTAVGPVQFSSVPDAVIITGDYTGPGLIDNTLNIPANRMQYDVINSDVGGLKSWTISYSPLVGPNIIGAATPIGYVDSSGVAVPQGGAAYGTLFNTGYGIYNYNPGSPWVIDYEVDHITFIWNSGTPPSGLPIIAGVGYLAPTVFLPSFSIEYSPNLPFGQVPASALTGTVTENGTVYGPLPNNPCISIHAPDITVYTCSNCTPVAYNVKATNICCPGGTLTLVYDVPSNNCFYVNTTTPVTVTAHDGCGDTNSTVFNVHVLPASGCGSNSCINLTANNILAYTCSNCTAVSFNAKAVDTCCGAGNVTLVYSVPTNFCFPIGSTPVTVSAFDSCGNSAGPVPFIVTVSQGYNCPSNCITLTAGDIYAYTCSNCTAVSFNAKAVDTCCTSGGVTLVYSFPTNFCFPLGSTMVTVSAHDPCNNSAGPVAFNVYVMQGPACPTNNCITLNATDVVAYTCSNCTSVTYNAQAFDQCCPLATATLVYSIPTNFCFPLGSTMVTVSAHDPCGYSSSPVTFNVMVMPGPTCQSNNCITLTASNITAYTCGACTNVTYNVTAVDLCCSNLTLVYNPPTNYCFPINKTTPVTVNAYDQCGHYGVTTFLVTVLPGPNCAGQLPGLTLKPSGTSPTSPQLILNWPTVSAQLEQSMDLIHWTTVPGLSNPPVVIGGDAQSKVFYHLKYN